MALVAAVVTGSFYLTVGAASSTMTKEKQILSTCVKNLHDTARPIRDKHSACNLFAKGYFAYIGFKILYEAHFL
jgi:hypothetical protein